ncbi:MAG: tetratricopeptide repeat protein [Bacteroidales bacterium]|nr:tetratricopeptide repeat protein [Bacteroidales bacterium]
MKRFIFYALIFFAAPAFTQSAGKMLWGNINYLRENFNEADVKYREALTKKPELPQANYNLGNAKYRQEQYGAAATKYTDAIQKTNNPEKLSQYYYNMGNAHFKNNDFKASVEAYKNALRQNPENADARHNLVLAQQMLRQQQQQEEQNQQEQNNEENKENKNEDSKQQQQQQQQQQNMQVQPGQISKDDAERLLNALEQQEKQVLDKLEKQKAAVKKVPVDKEW